MNDGEKLPWRNPAKIPKDRIPAFLGIPSIIANPKRGYSNDTHFYGGNNSPLEKSYVGPCLPERHQKKKNMDVKNLVAIGA